MLLPVWIALSAIAISAAGLSTAKHNAKSTLSDWLRSEAKVATQGILDNIGSSGRYAGKAGPGIVIASPSTESPDCEYTKITGVRHAKPQISILGLVIQH